MESTNSVKGSQKSSSRSTRPTAWVLSLRSWGWGLGSKLRRVAEGGRQWEMEGDNGSLLLRVFGASTHEQETLGATGSNRKQQEVAAVNSPTQPLT